MSNVKGLSVHPLIKAGSIYQSSTKRKWQRKRVRQKKRNVCYSECCKSLPLGHVREAHASWNFQEYPLESRGNPRVSEKSKMPTKGILALKRKHSSEKRSSKFSRQILVRRKFQDKFPCLTTVWPKGLRSGKRSQKSVHTNFKQSWRLDDTYQRKDVHSRPWRFVTDDGVIFWGTIERRRLFDSQANPWTFRPSTVLRSQTRKQKST